MSGSAAATAEYLFSTDARDGSGRFGEKQSCDHADEGCPALCISGPERRKQQRHGFSLAGGGGWIRVPRVRTRRSQGGPTPCCEPFDILQGARTKGSGGDEEAGCEDKVVCAGS